jgi:hypothetical protein
VTASIFQRALGAEFTRLHPQLQRRFGFASSDRTACIGMGVMDEIWRGPLYTVPFLALGTRRHILFPERGRRVPFTIENYAYVDRHGRETVTFVRTFEFTRAKRRRFDATMVYSDQRGRVVDYLGTHQHLAVELELRVDDKGGLHIRTSEQRFRERSLDFRLPESCSASAEVHEWYDEGADRFGIDVRVTNRRFGPVFGYRGTFTAAYVDTGAHPVPDAVKPEREEVRC